MALVSAEGGRVTDVRKVVIPNMGKRTYQSRGNLHEDIERAVKEIQKGRSVDEIAAVLHMDRALADQICVWDEEIDDTQPLTIFDPLAVWKTKKLTNFVAKELLKPIFKEGKLVYQKPSLTEIRSYCAAQIDLLWDEVKRFQNPHNYYVDLSEKLWLVKRELLNSFRDE